jgi:tRNA dimethylallyltransferase
MTRPILIAGPTASGKSALALALAERLGGIIINADSMQVYRELSVLTARPSNADLARAPHRLYGHVAGAQGYSAGRYVREVSAVLSEAAAAGQVPILVGGTGLYFKALLDGLSPVPDIPTDVRARWRAAAESLSQADLHAELAKRDPAMAARLPAGDRQRIVRALEVIEATGRSLADWHQDPQQRTLDADRVNLLVVTPEREKLYRRCDARFDIMMREGAVDEVRRLMALKLSPDLPVMRALGVAPLAGYLLGRMLKDDAVELAKIETRQYAKRQLTWLRKHMMSWKWLETNNMNVNTIINDILL